jgi:Asp-tRNA(Asn)/Glu-tRNA(Gln) amidotransferase A subunit family amidase
VGWLSTRVDRRDSETEEPYPEINLPLTTTGIRELSALQLAAEVVRGRLSASEIVADYIRRVEEVNPRINALVVPLLEEAARVARTRDAERSRGKPLGPLHGVPISVKESFHVKGTDATAGVRALMGRPSKRDSLLVQRLRLAGAILLGKTNLSQLVWFNEADNPVFGRTNNPWNLDRSPGGSSGGEAALIAAGGSPLGFGTDAAGSVRKPAHACGIHSLKPTPGRLSAIGTVDNLITAGQEAIPNEPGPLARRVCDLKMALAVLTSPPLGDPLSPPVKWAKPSAVSVAGLRIAYYESDGSNSPSPAIRRVLRDAAAALADRGADITTFSVPAIHTVKVLCNRIFGADGGSTARRLLGDSERDWRIELILSNASGRSNAISSEKYFAAVNELRTYQLKFLNRLDDLGINAIICPPSALPAITHGASLELEAPESYAVLFNAVGLPAGVVAASRVRPGEESDRTGSGGERSVENGSVGLPVGVQVAAKPWRDDIVLAIMGALEEHFARTADYPSQAPI